jgi:hypothetical protein
VSGAIGGLGTAFILRHKKTIQNWSSIISISSNFAIGLAVIGLIYYFIGMSLGWDSNLLIFFLLLLPLCGMIGGAICGVGLIWQLRKESAGKSQTLENGN